MSLDYLRFRITELEQAYFTEAVMHPLPPLKRPIFTRRIRPIALALEACKQAELDYWPVQCPIITKDEVKISTTVASDLGELVPAMTALASQLEREHRQSLAARGYVA